MDTKNECIVHIGYHKTASTFLQQQMFANKDLPYNMVDRKIILKLVIHSQFLSFNKDEVRREITKQFVADKINVISEENISGNPHSGGYNIHDNCIKIKQMFPTAKILLCIREQAATIYSGYKQYVRTGGSLSLKKYLKPTIRNQADYPMFSFEYFEYDKIIALYQKEFGKENVLVLPFEMFVKTPKKFISSILEFTGVQQDEGTYTMDVGKQVNKALPYYTTALKRRYNLLFIEDRKSPNYMFKLPSVITKALFVNFGNFESRFFKGIQKKTTAKKYALINQGAGNAYTESNKRTSELIGIDLKQYGYQ